MKQNRLFASTVFLLVIVSFYSYAQTDLPERFDPIGPLEKWTDWTEASYPGGDKIQYRSSIFTNQGKGCLLTVEVKNIGSAKAKGAVFFQYNIENVDIPMTGSKDISVKVNATESVSYAAHIARVPITSPF